MKLAIIGTGKMGTAIMIGALNAGFLQANDIGIYDIDTERLAVLSKNHGVTTLTRQNLAEAPHALIAVKPQYFKEVAPLLAGQFQAYFSIMAGIDLSAMSAQLKSRAIIRFMPNLGAAVSASATAMSVLDGVSQETTDFAQGLFESIGTVYALPETLIDAFTGLAGSGPAFVALVAEALADGGVRMGLPRELAQSVASQVLFATSQLLKEKDPALLKNEVASPGGTTIAGIKALEKAAVRHAMMQAVEDAALQGQRLGQG